MPRRPPEANEAQRRFIEAYCRVHDDLALARKMGLPVAVVAPLRAAAVARIRSPMDGTGHVRPDGRPTGAYTMTPQAAEAGDGPPARTVTPADVAAARDRGDKALAADLLRRLGEQMGQQDELLRRLNADRWVDPR